LSDHDDDLIGTMASGGAALAAATVAKKVLTRGWERRRGAPPGNPASADTTWGEAIGWAVLSGVVVGLVRLVAQRGVALAFEQRKGGLPAKAAATPPA
jgi:hypothetical protein